ncbi:MAG: hypothetical protein FJ014_19460 [Chloroflexi bacterium]|nr:hypothetical protein [Chloroflexota bacterium]
MRALVSLLFLTAWLTLAGSVSFKHFSPAAAIGTQQNATPTLAVAPTLTAIPTPVPTTAPTPLPPVYEQMLAVEKSVLETTRSTLGFVFNVITVVLAALGLGGFGAYWIIERAARRAEDAAGEVREVKKASKQALGDATAARESLDAFKAEMYRMQTVAKESVDALKAGMEHNRADLERAKGDVQTWRKATKHDIVHLRYSMLSVQIEEYRNDLSGDDPVRQWKAKQALKAMTDISRPALIRRRSVEALAEYALLSQDKEIIDHLKVITEQDHSKTVRDAAQRALQQTSGRLAS